MCYKTKFNYEKYSNLILYSDNAIFRVLLTILILPYVKILLMVGSVAERSKALV